MKAIVLLLLLLLDDIAIEAQYVSLWSIYSVFITMIYYFVLVVL